ncbi:hypothetical protein [Nocardioides halotolerans]|uniref:hypothetical protein n=1 Tax=Nocardioides halotolerans TaxID=433660 RepID=UPI0004081741|nr:hypothetical protein [Nocardioides halotolerans]
MSTPEPDWQRKRRLTEVFGDVLPETTSDERDPAEQDGSAAERSDTWLKEQVPPHHGS